MTVLDSFSLAGKRALVTGASQGIGAAVAKAFAEAGAEVVLCARSEENLARAVEEIAAFGGRAEAFVADVTDVAAFSRGLSRYPAFDVFLNNAGTNRPKPLQEVTEDDYAAVMDLNVKASVFAAKAVAEGMIAAQKGGSIINMSSQMGHVGAANRTLYCASKWAMEGFTKALAVELGHHAIRVNTICPTFIETPMTAPMFADPAFRASVLGKIKLGRLGAVCDIVGGAIYLASDASALMTGSALMLDGGWTAD